MLMEMILPDATRATFDLGPILGIWFTLMSYARRCSAKTAPVSEYGKTEVDVDKTSILLKM